MPEIRTTRVEDWEGNVYLLGGAGGGQGGISTDSTDIGKGGSTTSGSHTNDVFSNSGECIELSSSGSADQNLATVDFTDVTFGDYSVSIRMKSDFITKQNNPLLTIYTYYHIDAANGVPEVNTLLSTTDVHPELFNEINVYQTFGFVTRFKGTFNKKMSLRVAIMLRAQSEPPVMKTVRLDNITVNHAYTGLTGVATLLA